MLDGWMSSFPRNHSTPRSIGQKSTKLIASDGWPDVPEFPGLQYVTTSNEVFGLDEFPKRGLVVGGG